MNWDWDKLQEKRQRQGSWTPQQDDDTQAPRNPQGPDWGKQFRKLSGSDFAFGKWLVLGVVVLWLLSGIYIIQPDELGVVLRFGQYNRTVEPGPHYALPYPFESVYKPKVTQVQRSEIGFRSGSSGTSFQQGIVRTEPEESAMLTGDENIVNVQFSVQYQIKNPVEYLFNVTNHQALIRNAAEAAMREIIGKSSIDAALTDGKLQIQNETTALLQEIMNKYQVGVRIIAVQMQDVHPPKDVIDAFKDVASAREDKSRIINEAEAYHNEIIPKTRGLAAEVVNQAQAYREARIRGAKGETERFLQVLQEYNKSKDITRKRLYYEAMEEILSQPDTEKLILPKDSAGRVLPHLSLNPTTFGSSIPDTAATDRGADSKRGNK